MNKILLQFSDNLDGFLGYCEELNFTPSGVYLVNEKKVPRDIAFPIYIERPIRRGTKIDYTGYLALWWSEKSITEQEYNALIKDIMTVFYDYKPKVVSDYDIDSLDVYDIEEKILSLAQFGNVIVEACLKENKNLKKLLEGKNKKNGRIIAAYKNDDIPVKTIVEPNWLDQVRSYCSLLDRWCKQQYLSYNDRLKLFTNLKYLKRGDTSESIVNEVLKYYVPEEWTDVTEPQIRGMFRPSHYKPVNIVECGESKMTVPHFFKYSNHSPAYPTDERASLVEIDKIFPKTIHDFLASDETAYLTAPCAIGKTEHIIKYLREQDFGSTKIVVALPRYNLIHEFVDRLKIKCNVVPEPVYTLFDKKLLSIGKYAANKNPSRVEFIKNLISSENGLYVVTHSLIANLASKVMADRIIIDENIEDSLIRKTNITIGDVNSLRPYVSNNGKKVIDDLIETILNSQRGDVIKLDDFRNIVLPEVEDKLDALLNNSNIELPNNIFDCEYNDGICGEGYFFIVTKSDLISHAILNHIPIKMLTATPLSARIKNMYGENIPIIDVPIARNTGKISVFRGITGARGLGEAERQKNRDKAEEYIREKLTPQQIKSSQLITFDNSKDDWEDRGFIVAHDGDGRQHHFRNTSGVDAYKGRNLIIVGKADLPHSYYQDLASQIKPWIGNLTKSNQIVYLNGFRQKLYLYDDPDIRAEQLQNIQFLLEQACGRSRCLRTPANVYLFSNFIPRGCDIVFD